MRSRETDCSPGLSSWQSCHPDASRLNGFSPLKLHPQLVHPSVARMQRPHRYSFGALGPTSPNGSLTEQVSDHGGTLEPHAPHRAVTSSSAQALWPYAPA